MHGRGFSFQAPANWTVVGNAAANGPVDRVEVDTFALVHPYASSKRIAVAHELDIDAADLAQQLRGTVSTGSTLQVAGLDAWRYSIVFGGKVEEITFAFRRDREYELLCRRRVGTSDAFCAQLTGSFRLG